MTKSVWTKIILFSMTMLLSSTMVAQTNLDSLERIASKAVGDEKLSLLIELGEKYIPINPDKSLDFGLQALLQAKNQRNSNQEANALLILGKANFKISNLGMALRNYNRALGEYEKLGLLEEQTKTLVGLSEVYDFARTPEMALIYLDKAYAITVQLKNYPLQIEVLMNLGNIHSKKGNHRNALTQFTKILQIIGNGNLTESQKILKINCYSKIGQSYINLGEFEKSLEVFKNASYLAKSINDWKEIEKSQRAVALSFYLIPNLDSALAYYSKAYNLSNLHSDSTEMMLATQGIGDVYFEKEKFNLATNSFNRQLSIAEKINDIQGIVTSLVKISRCYYVSGDYPTSTNYLNRALVIAKRENLYSTAADVYQYLSLISESEGKFKDALSFYKLWAEIRDSIYSGESGEKLAKLQILYDISQKEKENEILRQGSEIQKLQLSRTGDQRLILIAVAISFFVLIIFLILLYQAKRKEVQKQKEAEQKIVEINKELERRMIQEIKKQEKQQQLLSQKSKLESLGTLAAGIAHEINQPLGGISMGLDNILLKVNDKNYTEPYLKEKISTLFDNIDRIKRIIDHIRIFSRTQKPIALEQVDINEVISNALFMVNTQYQTHNVDIQLQLTSDKCLIIGDKFKLEQVVLNLLSNAKHAVDEKEKKMAQEDYKKRITIKSWTNNQNVCFSIGDNGIGINSDNIEKIYDPFFTTKSEEKGTGLGLSITYGFIKDILGEIKVDSQLGEFSVFEISIPKS